MKTSHGGLKEHYLGTGRCEAVHCTVVCHLLLAQLRSLAMSVWRWGGCFPHRDIKALWLQLILLPSVGLAD